MEGIIGRIRQKGKIYGAIDMIFVTVGGGPYYGFNRLVKAMDDIAGRKKYNIVMQIGCSSYVPAYASFFKFTEMSKMLQYYMKADVVVAHASGAPVIYARDYSVPLALVPRMAEFGEIFDDHQHKTAKKLENHPMIEIVYDTEDIEKALEKSILKKSLTWPASEGRETITKLLYDFINGNKK